MPVRATVLVALDEDCVAAGDQEARRRVMREIIIQCQVGAAERRKRDARLSDAHEARGGARLANVPATEDLVQMAVGADAVASTPERHGIALRVAQARTKRFGVGAA